MLLPSQLCLHSPRLSCLFFHDTVTTSCYTLSLHDALPIFLLADEPSGNLDSTTSTEIMGVFAELHRQGQTVVMVTHEQEDRKSTRLNSSHVKISYAVFCLKKKIKINKTI